MGKKDGDEFSAEETARRRDEALLRALNTPAKPHSEMKIGKRKAEAKPKERPASKGRVHKGKSRS
jgi:hypothetical protein